MRFAIPMVVALAFASAGCFRIEWEGPTVVLTTSYPGASAQVVADTVAAPIEQQVNGVERMVRMESESRNDGSYVARVRFRPYTDPNLAQVMVQNRAALASPVLPETVQKAGIAVKVIPADKADKGRVAIAIVDRGCGDPGALRKLSEAVLKRLSADGAMVKPEVFPGPDEDQVKVDIDWEKSCRHGVSVAEVFKVVQAAVRGCRTGAKTEPLKALKELPVTSVNGVTVPLGSLAAIEMVKGPPALYRVDMYPAVRITGSPPEGKTRESAASRSVELADAEREIRNDADGFAVMNLTAR